MNSFKIAGFAAVVAATVLLAGCDGFMQGPTYGGGPMEHSAQQCTQLAAYEIGFYDGRNKAHMRSNVASHCPEEQEEGLNSAYQQGYQAGITAHPEVLPRDAGMQSDVRRRAYGRDIYEDRYENRDPKGRYERENYRQRDSYRRERSQPQPEYIQANPVQATKRKPGEQCLKGVNGRVCGYNCMKYLDIVKCGRTPSEKCVRNKKGEIKCGHNCRVDRSDNITCG